MRRSGCFSDKSRMYCTSGMIIKRYGDGRTKNCGGSLPASRKGRSTYVERPFREAGNEPPQFLVLPSPYRFIIIPLVQYILDLSEKHPDRRIVVVIPELVEDHWYEYFLHNQRGRLLEWTMLVRGNERIFTVSSPYYISEKAWSARAPEAKESKKV